eukprot:764091-Hanusia_phi.AAC.16
MAKGKIKRLMNPTQTRISCEWNRIVKRHRYYELIEKRETEEYRERIYKTKVNEVFFSRKKKSENIFGVDINSPLLPDQLNLHGRSVLEKAANFYEELNRGLETEEDKSKHENWSNTHSGMLAESNQLKSISREFSKEGKIDVKTYRNVHRDTGFDEEISSSFFEKYNSGKYIKTNYDLVDSPCFVREPKRNDRAKGTRYPMHFNESGISNIVFTRKLNGTCENEDSDLDSEERNLFQALFASYGEDAFTISRLMCNKSIKAIERMIRDSRRDMPCQICKNPEKGDEMILCDKCDKGYHIFCLDPPLKNIPDGDWFCYQCKGSIDLHGSSRHGPEQDPIDEGISNELSGRAGEAEKELVEALKIRSLQEFDKLSSFEFGKNRIISLDDIHYPQFDSIFKAYLLTCPVPVNGEQGITYLVPLRRHLRIIVASTISAFMTLQIEHIKKERYKDKHGRHSESLDLKPSAAPYAGNDGYCGRYMKNVRVGDKIFFWQCNRIAQCQNRWRLQGGGLLAVGRVTSSPVVSSLQEKYKKYCRPVALVLDPWKHHSSICIQLDLILDDPIAPENFQTGLNCTELRIFTNPFESLHRITSRQKHAIELQLQSWIAPSESPCLPKAFVDPAASDTDSLGASDDETVGTDVGRQDGPWKEKCSRLLKGMQRNRNAGPFLRPVDLVQLPDYESVLRAEGCSPICIQDIESKFANNQYHDHRGFVKDVRKMFLNAHVYNPERDPVHKMAEEFSEEFERKWTKIRNWLRNRKQEERLMKSVDKVCVSKEFPDDRVKDEMNDEKLQNSNGENCTSENILVEGSMSVPESAGENDSDKMHLDETVHEGSPHGPQPGSISVLQTCRICKCSSNNDKFLVCDMSGYAFHFNCLEEVPESVTDGPWVAPMHLLAKVNKEKEDDHGGNLQQLCCVCLMENGADSVECLSCSNKFHSRCARRNECIHDEEARICSDCRIYLSPPSVRGNVLKSTAILSKRILDYNANLLREANRLLASVDVASPKE